jgi:hypothetical protein
LRKLRFILFYINQIISNLKGIAALFAGQNRS